MKKSTLLTLAFVFSFSLLMAQNPCEENLDEVRIEVVEKVNTFTTNLEAVVDKEVPMELRQTYVRMIQELFKPDAIIEVSSTRSPTKTFSIPDYLARIFRFYDEKYRVTILEFQQVLLPENADFQEVIIEGKTAYVATATVTQWFCGSKKTDSRNIGIDDCTYSDVTTKNIEIILKNERDYFGDYCRVMLGDIKVQE